MNKIQKNVAMESQKVVAVATQLASAKGEDVRVYDIAPRTTLIDYAIVVAGVSKRRLQSLTQVAVEGLLANGYPINHVEGTKDSTWFLVDAGTVVVHIFAREERQRVAIDDLYEDLPLLLVETEDLKGPAKEKPVTDRWEKTENL